MMGRLTLISVILSLVAAACGDENANPIFATPTDAPSSTATFDPSSSTTTSVASTSTSEASSTTSTAAEIEPYPTPVVEDYLDGCKGEAGESYCICTIEEFQRRLTLEEFLELESADLESNPVFMDVVDTCINAGVDGVTTTTVGASATTTTEPEFTSFTDIETLTEFTIQDLERWWTTELPAVFGTAYEPVSEFGPYHPSQGDVPNCGGPLAPEQYEFNAFYCSINDSVQWDAENLMAMLFQTYGDFTVALVLAHEWGHAVQFRFGFDDFNQDTIVSELQADCLAGSWTGRIAREESESLRLDPGDLEEGIAGFLLIGDGLGFDPEDVNAHGGSFDRLNAFIEGFNEGTTECATYEDERPEIVSIPLRVPDDPSQGDLLDLPLAETAPLLIGALEIFWSIVYPELFGVPWVPVSDAIPYRPSSGTFPSCGGFTADRTFYEDRAFYCEAEDYVAWDDERLFPDLYAEIGDFAIGLILANEWGRAVQSRAGLPIDTTVAQLQVDCLTGVWAAALIPEDNPMQIVLSAGDLEEGIAGFLRLSAPAGEEGAVAAFDRYGSFKEGFFFGTDMCNI